MPNSRRNPVWKNRLALAAAVFALALLAARSSPATPLSLRECIDLAARQNLGYLGDLRDVEASREQLRQARSEFGLGIDASFDLPTYSESRQLQDDIALIQRVREENTTMEYQGRTTLAQRVPHVGRFSVTASGSRNDFSSNRRVDRREFIGDLQVAYTRDLLFTPAAEIQLQQAEIGLSISQSNLRRRELQLEEQVTNSFYDLVQAIRELEIQQQRLEQSTAALDLALRKFEIGLIAEVEALHLRVEKLRAEAEFTRAQTQIERQRDRLREILGMEMDDPLQVLTSVDHETVPIAEGPAVEIGLRRRSDLREAEWARQSSELSLDDLEQQLGPTAQLTTRLTLLGRGPDAGDVSSTFERSFVSAGVRMELPLVDGGERRARVRRAEIDLEKSLLNRESVERRVAREIRDAVRNVGEAEQQIELGREELAVAERTYDVERSRFELGLADSQELLQAQTALTQARLDGLREAIAYQRALAGLRVATMADLAELRETGE